MIVSCYQLEGESEERRSSTGNVLAWEHERYDLIMEMENWWRKELVEDSSSICLCTSIQRLANVFTNFYEIFLHICDREYRYSYVSEWRESIGSFSIWASSISSSSKLDQSPIQCMVANVPVHSNSSSTASNDYSF